MVSRRRKPLISARYTCRVSGVVLVHYSLKKSDLLCPTWILIGHIAVAVDVLEDPMACARINRSGSPLIQYSSVTEDNPIAEPRVCGPWIFTDSGEALTRTHISPHLIELMISYYSMIDDARSSYMNRTFSEIKSIFFRSHPSHVEVRDGDHASPTRGPHPGRDASRHLYGCLTF